MNIQAKIEEIRRQPEHIRMRYVLISVFVSMLFIGILWIFSITTSLQKEGISPSTESSSQLNQNVSSARSTQSNTTPSLNEWIKK